MFTVILMITTQTERKISIVFDDMIADIMTNNKFQTIITELFIRSRKLSISLVFITHVYFSVPKEIAINQQIAINYSAGIDYKDFMKI